MKTLASLDDLDDASVDDIFPIFEAYKKVVMSEARDPRGGCWHPSAIDMCGRRNVYEFLNYEAVNRLEFKSREIFRLGHKVHELIQETLRGVIDLNEVQITVEEEVPYDKDTDELFHELGIGGTADIVATITAPGWTQRGVVEAKSIKNENFMVIAQSRQARPGHLLQAHLYAYRFDAPVIWVWYYNKDTSEHLPLPYLFDPDIFREAISRFERLNEFVEQGSIPDREESWFSCKECPYTQHCQPEILKARQRFQLPKGFRR